MLCTNQALKLSLPLEVVVLLMNQALKFSLPLEVVMLCINHAVKFSVPLVSERTRMEGAGGKQYPFDARFAVQC